MTIPASEPLSTPAVAPAPAEPTPAPVPAATVEQTAAVPDSGIVVESPAGAALPAVRPSTDVVKPNQWAHEFLEFAGDTLEVRVPTPQAMSALSIGMGKYVSNKMKNDVSGLFIARHLSLESYEHIYSRLMDPDDAGYNSNTIGELIGALLSQGVDRLEKESEEAGDGAGK